jgi:hypothetical protein
MQRNTDITHWRVTICYTDQSKRSAKIYDISQLSKFVQFIEQDKVIDHVNMTPIYDQEDKIQRSKRRTV